MAAIFFSLLFVARVLAEEVSTPSSLLGPRNFNHHVFSSKYLQALENPEATKQGPVLFPNDAPPPPRPPLIVTSRPLLESIARSELNQDGNNTIPQSTQINNVIKPFLARVKDYRPFGFVATPAPDYDYGAYEAKSGRDRYEDYESKGPEYYHHRNTKDNGNSDDEEGKNYAFSYRVNDKATGDDFSHTQQSSGSATNGEYRVRLPDGRMQIVSYTADENGYQADVRYADDDKTTNNKIDHHNNDNYDYNHNNFNGNNNHLDSSLNEYNENHDPYNNNQFKEHNQYQYNDKIDYRNNYAQQKNYKLDDNNEHKSPAYNDYFNQYSDNSKEYYNDDFSKEFESKSYDYAPHRSKYTDFVDHNQNDRISPKDYIARSTVKPSFEELKDLLVTKKAYNTVQPQYDQKIPVTISVPSTTPHTFEGTTERVVLIGGKKSSFYTNIRNVPLVSPDPIIVTPSPVKYVTSGDFSVSPTPMNYLVSTINSLRNKVDLSGPKPILSNSYIDRINKYLTFN